jgi:hypothetical protein
VIFVPSVSVRSHSWIAAGAEPDAHQFVCHDFIKGVIDRERTRNNIALTQNPELGYA